MKNSEIIAGYVGLMGLMEKKEKYPVKFSFAITKNLKLLEGLNRDFEAERNRLLDIYNVKDDQGEPAYKTTGRIEIMPKYEQEWQREAQELLDIEVEADVHKVKLEDLDGISITPEDMLVCAFMITE